MRGAVITEFGKPLEVQTFLTRSPGLAMPSSRRKRTVVSAEATGTCGSTIGPGSESSWSCRAYQDTSSAAGW